MKKQKGYPVGESETKTAKLTDTNDSDDGSNTNDSGINDNTINDDESGAPAITNESWQQDLVTPQEHIILSQQSDTFDPKERYWQFRLICEAIQRSKIINADQDVPETHPTEEVTQY